MKRICYSSLVFCSILAPGAPAADGPFASLSFEEARKKAEAEKKMVFIDFYASWCVPCKMMDATTFKDPKVVEFLKNKVVALKVDAEKHTALAEKYNVSGYPTLTFLKPDGKITEVLAGVVEAKDFLHLAENTLAGNDTLTRHRKALREAPNDPVLQTLIARSLTVRGEKAEALKLCMEVLRRDDLDTFTAEIIPETVSQLLSLAEVTMEADGALQRYYDAAYTAILERKATNVQIAAYAAVHMLKGELGKILDTYDRLLAMGGDDDYQKRVTVLWRTPLLAAERFSDIARHVEILQEVQRMMARLPAEKPGNPPTTDGYDSESAIRHQVLVGSLEYYKVLTALDRHEDAESVAAKLLTVEASAEMYDALAWSAYQLGKVTEANLRQARKAHSLSGGKDVSIIDTLARILATSGKNDEAVKLVTEALEWAQPGFERAILEQCLADFRE